ncbi:MAG TPA: PASTA domain-containing protein, partial [Ruminococcus flavefaciens]|nr:PASTA domain-containing protein [Ruminococcus flavefaciens]
PDEGTEVHKGTKVVLYVSMGANAEQVVVEDYTGRTADDAVVMASYKGLKPRTEPVPSYEKEGTVVDQEPKKDEKVESGTEIVLYVSNGTTPDGEIPFTVYFPEGANGRFAIDFILKSADGKTDTVSSPTLLVPEMSSHTQNVKGSGENVNVTVVLTNLSTNQRANIGTYTFNFATNSVTKNSEDVEGAFRAVGGFTDQPATEAPQEQPQETPQEQPQDQTQEQQTQENIVHAERQEWVTGYYDESGNWIWYPGYGD